MAQDFLDMEHTDFNLPSFTRMKPVNNITPFTYSDGTTYLEILGALERYVRGLPEHLSTEVNRLIAEMNEALTRIEKNEEDFQNLLSDFIDSINARIADLVADFEERVEWINRREISSLAYRKRVVHSLPFKFPDYAKVYAKWGAVYPQAFHVDTRANELFVLYKTGIYNVAVVFDWGTGDYKSCFMWESQYTSEGLAVVYEGAYRWLYARTESKGLGRFDITVLPENMSTIKTKNTYIINSGRNFTYRHGVFTVSDATPPLGFHPSRGNYTRFNANMEVIGTLIVPELMAAGGPYKYESGTFPKLQGIADVGNGFAFSVGGYHKIGGEVTPYQYQGYRLFSAQGHVMADNLLHPERFADILKANGFHPTRVESEGVQQVGNKIVSFTLTSSGGNTVGNDTEGLLFLEEYADHPGAIDFTDAAVTWTAPDMISAQGARYPRQIDGKMYDPLTNEVLDSLPKIIEYMKSVNQSEFSFYSSSAAVTDYSGEQLPSGSLVRISNANNQTFLMSETEMDFVPSTKLTRIYDNQEEPDGIKVVSDGTNRWEPLPLEPGITAFSSTQVPEYLTQNGNTYLRGEVKGLPANPQGVKIGQIPDQYAPNRVFVTLQAGQGSEVNRFKIDADGEIWLERTSIEDVGPDTWFPLPVTPWPSK